MTDKRFDNNLLMAMNPDYAEAVARGERWALERAGTMGSLARGEPEGYRRKFDGKPRKWCGAACPARSGCITCTLPDNPDMARQNRNFPPQED